MNIEVAAPPGWRTAVELTVGLELRKR